jgi:hypothetical protein
MRRILPRLLTKGSLPGILAQTRSSLHAGLANADVVFRWVPNELEETIVLGEGLEIEPA